MDRNKAFRVAEMIRGALNPLERYHGKETKDWKSLSETEKREQTAAVSGVLLQMEKPDFRTSSEEADQIRAGIISVMYRDELDAKKAPKVDHTPQKAEVEKDKLNLNPTGIIDGSLKSVPLSPDKNTAINLGPVGVPLDPSKAPPIPTGTVEVPPVPGKIVK